MMDVVTRWCDGILEIGRKPHNIGPRTSHIAYRHTRWVSVLRAFLAVLP
jgi:hypothetical protein